MMKVGVIGCGYWGPNLVRNFMAGPDATVVAVCDLRPDRLTQIRASHPSLRTTSDCGELIADPAIDAIVVATPVATHFDLAQRVLAAGKHVLVEKPLAATSDEALRLTDEADRRNLI